MNDMDIGIGFYRRAVKDDEEDEELFHVNHAFPPPAVGETVTFSNPGVVYRVVSVSRNYRQLSNTVIVGIEVIVEPV